MIFETHAHYDDEVFDTDRDELLGQMKEAGIDYIVNIAAAYDGLLATKKLMEKYSFIYGAMGIHPSEIGALNEEVMQELATYADMDKTVAIGEIGLDYYWDKDNKKQQIYWFQRQMNLARQKGLPIVVHSRDAAADTLEVMKAEKAEEIGGVIHCYSYSVEMAKNYLDMGFYLGIGGVVTFSNAKKLREVVAYAPIERLVLETDSPYLSPVPNRGKRNSSLNIPYVVEEIAKIKGISKEDVMKITYDNAKKMYRIKE
ncbi:MAG TPA: TatD family hydrolase [Lachnospiraceae bacterium]